MAASLVEAGMMITCETCGQGFADRLQEWACPHAVIPEEVRDLQNVARAARALLLCGYEFDWTVGLGEYADALHHALSVVGGEFAISESEPIEAELTAAGPHLARALEAARGN
jgi:hypothetical protein